MRTAGEKQAYDMGSGFGARVAKDRKGLRSFRRFVRTWDVRSTGTRTNLGSFAPVMVESSTPPASTRGGHHPAPWIAWIARSARVVCGFAGKTSRSAWLNGFR